MSRFKLTTVLAIAAVCALSGCGLPASRAEWRQYRAVESLIAKGADLDAPDKDIDCGLRLHRAASDGHAAVVELLLENQASAGARDGLGYTALHYAARSGRTRIAEMLLDAGAYAEAPIETYHIGLEKTLQLVITPLHLAAWRGRLDTARMLLSRGVKADVAGWDNVTPLQFAAGGGHLKMVELLIAHGADPLAKTPNNTNAMHFAASGGTLIVEHRYGLCDALILPYDYDREIPDARKLTAHCGPDHGEIISLMLAKGAKINQTGAFGFAPIHFAADGLCVSGIEALIKGGADLTAGVFHKEFTSWDWAIGSTALHIAADPLEGFAAERRRDVLDALIRAGAAVDAVDEYGITPLHTASRGQRPEAVKQLLAAGADVNALSTSYPSEETVCRSSRILSRFPSFYRPDDPRLCLTTPLMAAILSSTDCWIETPEDAPWKGPLMKEAEGRNVATCSQRLRDTVAILLKNGADVKAALPNGETVLHVAAARSDGAPLVKMLLDAGADVNAKTKDGVTPLHYAAMNKSLDPLKILLASGAETNARSKGTTRRAKVWSEDKGWRIEDVTLWAPGTALDWAREGDREEAIKLLAPLTDDSAFKSKGPSRPTKSVKASPSD
jgi:cytohesin